MSQEGSNQPELIRFVVPNEKSTLFISNVSLSVQESDVRALFSQYGLIFSLKLCDPVNNVSEAVESHSSWVPSSDSKFGFVSFYSSKSAQSAISKLDKMKWIDGKRIQVRFSRKRKRTDTQDVTESTNTDTPQKSDHTLTTLHGSLSEDEFALPITSSIELANFYLGFKGWSSAILGIQPINPETVAQHLKDFVEDQKQKSSSNTKDSNNSSTKGNNFSANNTSKQWITRAYECQIKHIFNDGRSIVGTGQGLACAFTLYEAVEQAKKIAVTNARKDAFGRMLIVVLPSGKVGLHLLPQSYTTRPTTPCDEAEPSNL